MVVKEKPLSIRLFEFLGRGNSKTSIITSALITTWVFFYIFTLGSLLSIEVFSLKDRVTYVYNFQYYIVSNQVDRIMICLMASACLILVFRKVMKLTMVVLVYVFATAAAIFFNTSILLAFIALLSVPWIIGLVFYGRVIAKDSDVISALDMKLTLNYVAIAAIFLGFQSLFYYAAPIFPHVPGQSQTQLQNYVYLIFILFSSASPFLFSLLVFCIPSKILLEEIVNLFASIKKKTIGPPSRNSLCPDKLSSRIIIIFLSLIVLFSIILATIPHLPFINKDNQLIGVDTHYYVNWESQLIKSNSTFQFLNTAFVKISGGDRPISILFFLGLANISGGHLDYVADRLPMILGPLLVIAIFFLTRELTSNNLISLIAAFLTTVSLQTMVGLYAGFYSNWFAIVIGYFSIAFLLRYLKRPAKINLLLFSFLWMVLLFSHTYTWTILGIVTSIFLVILAKLNYYRRRSIGIIFLVIAISVSVDFVRVELTASNGAVESDLAVAISSGVGFQQFSERWNNLTDTVWTYYGGLMSNFIVLSLAIYWLVRARIDAVESILIMAFLSAGIFPLLFTGWGIQSRVLYDLPFQIPAAVALGAIRKNTSGPLFVTAICLWLVAISIRAVANLTF